MKIFSFNEKRNGSYIDSVSGAVGVNTNGEWVRTDKGIAWRGNGVDSKITLASTIDLVKENASIEVWFANAQITPSNSFILGYNASGYKYIRIVGDNIGMESNTNGDFWFSYDGVTYTNAFQHLLIVADNGTVKSYIDGVLVDTRTPTDDVSFLYIGAYSVAGPNLLDIGRIQIYDHVLTEAERAKLYNEFNNAHPTSTIIK